MCDVWDKCFILWARECLSVSDNSLFGWLSCAFSSILVSTHCVWKQFSGPDCDNQNCICCCQVISAVSDTGGPHRWQPIRLPHPWNSPGKNTGVGCHFLLQCMKVKSESEVVQLCPTLCDPMDCSLPGSSAHGIFQARVLEWGAIAFSANLPLDIAKCSLRGKITSSWKSLNYIKKQFL